MKLKKYSDHIFTITTISAIMGKGVCGVGHDDNMVAWTGAGLHFCVWYYPNKRLVRIDEIDLTDAQHYAILGFCALKEIDIDSDNA